ncbi:sulfotransferase family cytosolic 1B member 1-like [Pecten maximus]|uniref:sulfotransferase family cytosolic 1B member 1-like n=1 Tax=Pecten maximus TaxID=6579 RepID=UPI0014587165|nr:sulfotransferase family cytosolic 1B member 1-like [Pecten maximus]
MELVKKTDDQGNTIIFKRYHGRAFHKEIPGNIGDQLEKVASLRCKPDDVLLCTFPRSGTHWVFNMTRMIQMKTLQYTSNPVMVEFEDVGRLDNVKSPRLFHTHLTYPFIPKAAKGGQLKLIYVLRNPKDIACSYYKYMSRIKSTSYIGNFDGFLKAFLTEETISCGGSWFTHTREWNSAICENRDLKILILRYECLTKNLYPNLVKIANFLEVDQDETFLRNVERTVSFENLKQEHATKAGENELWEHLGDKGRLPIYNKGIVGNWKNEFTVAQNEAFDVVYKEKMCDIGVNLEFDYE